MIRKNSANPAPALHFVAAVVVLLTLLGVGCSTDVAPANEPGTLWLSPHISVQDHPLVGEITDYRIIGYRPASASSPRFDQTFPAADGTQIQINNLQPGGWRIDVEAFNGAGTVIFFGTAGVSIEADGVAPLTVELVPDGEGQLVFEFRWPDAVGYIDVDSVEVEFTRYNGSNDFGDPVTLDAEDFDSFAPQAGHAGLRYEGTHPAGHYELSYQVLDQDGTPLDHFAPPGPLTFWIIPQDVVLLAIDLETGAMDVEIVINLQEPLGVELLNTQPALASGQTITVTAHVSGGTPPYSYRWYLNGVQQLDVSGSEITVGEGLDPGRHRLTVIVLDAQVLGSAWHAFDVAP